MEAPLEFDPVSSSSMRTTLAILFFVISLGLIGYAFQTLGSSDSRSLYSPSPTVFRPLQTITVDIQGAVERPGIQKFSIPFDGQVYLYEAIEKAGGFRTDANTQHIAKNINLAGTLRDGQKLYIPYVDEDNQEVLGTTHATININTASLTTLMNLQGIGKTRAESIIKTRPHTNVQSVVDKAKIPASVVEGFKDDISF